MIFQDVFKVNNNSNSNRNFLFESSIFLNRFSTHLGILLVKSSIFHEIFNLFNNIILTLYIVLRFLTKVRHLKTLELQNGI